LEDEGAEDESGLPFSLELTHYECVELALAIAQAEPPQEFRLQEDPISQTIYFSDLAWPLVYRFPVHRIGPSFHPQFPQRSQHICSATAIATIWCIFWRLASLRAPRRLRLSRTTPRPSSTLQN
jgi:hypothetical protein